MANALKHIEKEFGKGSIMRLGEASANMNVETIPTGILPLDVALGVGGPALAGDGGEAHEELALVALGGEDRGAGELGDGAGDGEGAPGA